MTVDPAFEAEELFAEQPTRAILSPASGTLSVGAILADADGRLFRTATVSGTLTTAHQRLIIPIVDPAAGVVDGILRPTGPLRLDAIELVIDVADQVNVFGSVDLVSVEASSAAADNGGWVAVAVDPLAPGWQWRQISQQRDVTFTPTRERPGRVSISHDGAIPGGEAGFGTTTFRLGAGLPDNVALPAIASTSFLTQTGNSVGDSLQVSSLGVPVQRFDPLGEEGNARQPVGDRRVDERRIVAGMLAHIRRQDAVERVGDCALRTRCGRARRHARQNG